MIGNGRVQEGNYMLEANPSQSTECCSKALEEKGYAPKGDGVRDNIRLGQASMGCSFYRVINGGILLSKSHSKAVQSASR